MNTERKPEITVFAGPNGSGKSTITSLLKPPYEYINADEIKATTKCSDLTASQTADDLKRMLLNKDEDFAFETVLSTSRNLELLREAKQRGYFIKCYYMLTADPAINVARVKLRAMSGGHDVPTDKIIKRYYRACKLLPELITLCDICHIYDNSLTPYRIFKKRKNELFYDPKSEFWNRESIFRLCGVSEAKEKNLNY